MMKCQTKEKDNQVRESSQCLNQAELQKKTGQRGLLIAGYKRLGKKLWKGHNYCNRGHVPAYVALPGSPQAKQLYHLQAQPSLEQSCHRQKNVFRLGTQGHFDCVQPFETLWTVACQASLSGGFSRQEYCNVLTNTGCHTPLEHYISCCPSHQLP